MAEQAAASVSPQPGRCAYFVERKRRFCKMVAARGRRFCGEHSGPEEENGRKRIPCPLDSKHTVYEDQLQKHLRKCNSREKPKPVYFVEGINMGLKEATELSEEKVPISALSKEELEDLIRKLKRASNGINCVLKKQVCSHQALQEALNDPQNGDAAIKHLKQQLAPGRSSLQSLLKSSFSKGFKTKLFRRKKWLGNITNFKNFAYTHVVSKASILGNMERLHLLGPRRCFVEFGAGRGKLSHWVDIALQDAKDVHFLLVERETTRFKVDGKHRKNSFDRLQVDIQHLCLNKVPVLVKEELPVVGIGKHVCGSATDLALRCLIETYANVCGDDGRESPTAKRWKSDGASRTPNSSLGEMCRKSVAENWRPVTGIVVALCCHHRCDWKHYVGREFFTTIGLGETEFNFFKRMSSWATCGMRGSNPQTSTVEAEREETSEPEEHDPHDRSMECSTDNQQGLMTVEERKQIGRLCKLLLDHGRIEYLQQRGYDAILQYYTDHSVSLENVLLTAVPHQSSLSHLIA